MRKGTIKNITAKYGISLVYLFGSKKDEARRYLEGEEIAPDPYSDLDIAVAFDRLPIESVQVYGRLYWEVLEPDPERSELWKIP